MLLETLRQPEAAFQIPISENKNRESISISFIYLFPDKFQEHSPLIGEDTFLIRAGRLNS